MHRLNTGRPGKNVVSRLPIGIAALVGMMLPAPASAQSDKWEIEVAPLYLWASEIDGRITTSSRSVPIFMSFGEAADHLSGIFSLHVEGRRNRWGFMSDIGFVGLSTDAVFATPFATSVDGTAELDTTVFEAGASYLVAPEASFSILGGVRVYAQSPKIEFEGPFSNTLTPVDSSRSATSVFGGFTYRPQLSEKWRFVSRADIGGGQAFTWSGTVGFDYRFNSWGSVMFGYRALGIDTGDVPEATTLPATIDEKALEYDVTHYGPIFAMTLRWKQK